MNREVTERDLRMPEFRDSNVDEYEFRGDGKIVRKDRWINGIQSIRFAVGINSREFEIAEVVERVRYIAGLTEGVLDMAGDSIWADLRGGAQ